MEKKNRIALFHEEMQLQAPASNPLTSWTTMINVLSAIEVLHAPIGTEHMTILGLDNKDVQAYGQGGYAIPLIGYTVFINANGAIGIKSAYQNGVYTLLRPGADGMNFLADPGWTYQYPK